MSGFVLAHATHAPRVITTPEDVGTRTLLTLIRERPRTRGELMHVTGLVRSTLTKHLDALTEMGLVRSREYLPSTGGRPPEMLSFDAEAGLVLAGDLGHTSARLALTDLAGKVLFQHELPFHLEIGPEATVAWLASSASALLTDAGQDARRISAIGVCLPALVDPRGGRIVDALGLPDWEDFRLADALATACGVPAVVDSDVNLMALGEQILNWPGERDLIFVKIDSSIAAGLLIGGRLLRGTRGFAGDIAHVQLESHKEIACVCGGHGCLAAFASGAALARRIEQATVPTSVARDAGHAIGAVLSVVINTVNPATVVLGGSVTEVGPQVLAAVREEIYRRSRAVATQDLRVVISRTWASAGLVGASRMAIEQLLAPDPLDSDLVAIT